MFNFVAKHLYSIKYQQLRVRLIEELALLDSNSISYVCLSNLLISGEDHRFHYHGGFDVIAIFRAIIKNIFFNKREGASTIEQQLVRVLTGDFESSFRRKIQEIFLATTVTEVVPKSIVPMIYLNVAYYGKNMNGIKQILDRLGVENYQSITAEQAAEVVSRIKYPENFKMCSNTIDRIASRKKHLLMLYQAHKSRRFFKIYE